MATVMLKKSRDGDVLARDVDIDGVILFEAGTVLVNKIIEILNILDVETVVIESRNRRTFGSLKEVFRNIDLRFSYVEGNSLMMSIKYMIKDILSNMRQ